MKYQTAKAIIKLPEYAAQLLNCFSTSDTFTSREYEEKAKLFNIPSLSVARRYGLVKVVKKETFEVTFYEFELPSTPWSRNRYIRMESLTKTEAIAEGLSLEDAAGTHTETSVRYYYQIADDILLKATEQMGAAKRCLEISKQITKLELQLKALRRERQAI